MTGQIISQIRASKDQANPQPTYGNFPAGSSDADSQRRASTSTRRVQDEGLVTVMSQVAWQADLNVGQRLSPVLPRYDDESTVTERKGHDESQGRDEGQSVGGGCRATGGDRPKLSKSSLAPISSSSCRVQPANSDVTQDADPQGRRRRRRARKKCRRHCSQQQQTRVNITITGGHLSAAADGDMLSLPVPSL